MNKLMVNPALKKSLLLTVTLCFWFAQYVYVPFLTPYLLSLSISATVAGVIVGAYGLTQLILRIPLGIALDIHRRHKLVVTIGALLAGLSSIGMLLFPSPAMLFLSNCLSGVASSAWISYTVLYASYYDGRQTSRAIGTITVFFQGGVLLGFLVGGLLVGRYGIQNLFKVSFASGAIGAALSLFIPHEPAPRGTNVNVASLLKVVRDRRVVTFSLFCAVSWFVVCSTVFSFSTSTARSLGATGSQLGFFSALYCVGTIAGSYFTATRRAHRLGEVRLLVAGYAVLAFYSAAIGFTVNLLYFYPLHLICGLGNGVLMACTMSFAVREIDPEKKTTAMGCFQSIYCIGITGGPMVMGALIDHGGKIAAFCAVAALSLACAVLLPFLYSFGFLVSHRNTDSFPAASA